MGWFRTTAIGLAAAVSMLAPGAARAGELGLIYWGAGDLEWFQLDGVNYDVDDYSVIVNDVDAGWHTMTYGANGSTHNLSVNLSTADQIEQKYWCMDLELDSFDLLDGDECDDMWDYYEYGF